MSNPSIVTPWDAAPKPRATSPVEYSAALGAIHYIFTNYCELHDFVRLNPAAKIVMPA